MKVIVSTVMLLFAWATSIAQLPIAWERHYDHGQGDMIRRIVERLDGSLVCLSMSYWVEGWHVYEDIVLQGLDSMGIEQWSRTYHYDTINYGSSIAATSDGGFIIAGDVGSDVGELYYDDLLLKVDSMGNQQWMQTYDIRTQDFGSNVFETETGYVLFGTSSASASSDSIHVIFTDASGNLISQRLVSYVNGLGAVDVLTMNGGGYLLLGDVRYNANGYTVLLRMTAEGDTVWTRRFHRNPLYACGSFSLLADRDGGYVIAGNDFEGDSHPSVLKTNATGELMWWRVLPEPGLAADIDTASAGGYYVTGITTDASWENQDGSLWRFDDIGNLMWTWQFGGLGSDRGRTVKVSPVHGLLLGGRSSEYGDASGDGYLVKFGADTTTCGRVDLIASNGPPNWGFRLVRQSGSIAQFGFTNLPDSFAYSLTGAAADWEALPSGDGNDGDSLIFLTDIPFVSQSVDTFFLILPDNWCSVEWWCGCSAGMIPLDHRGQVSWLTGDSAAYAWRLNHQSGNLARVVIGPLPAGSQGWTSGDAATDWQAMLNGDENNGDSVIFFSSVPLTEGLLDTFWVRPGADECSIVWRAGCASDTASVFVGVADSMHMFATFGPGPDTLRVQTQLEANLSAIEIWRMRWGSGPPERIALFAPYNDASLHEYIAADTTTVWSVFFPAVVDVNGCRLERRDLSVSSPYSSPDPSAIPRSADITAYPNPFNPVTTVVLSVPMSGQATVQVVDLLGRHVTTLHEGTLESGEHKFTFDGSNLPSGLYFARVQAGEFVKTQKLLLLK